MQKLILSAVLFFTLCGAAQAQAPYSSPYDMFKSEHETAMANDSVEMWVFHHGDTLSSIYERIEGNKSSDVVVFHTNNDSVYLKPLMVVKWNIDPLAGEYPNTSPYVYCLNNPMNMIDPDGRNPIVSQDGTVLGASNNDWKGTTIVMNAEDYNKNGMSNEEALKAGTELDKYGEGIRIPEKEWEKVEANGGTRMTPYLQNNSTNTVFYKPEDKIGIYENNGAYPVEAGKDVYMPIDGVKTVNMKSDEVFKVFTGGHAIINKNGSISTDFLTTIGRVVPEGYRYSSGLVKTPDGSFTNLANSIKTK